jgi:hypothetical protein
VEKVKIGLSALYESCIAINAAGDIFLSADFVNDAGGAFRSTDNSGSWTPANNGLECGNIWSLAINSTGEISAGPAGCEDGVYRSTDNVAKLDAY